MMYFDKNGQVVHADGDQGDSFADTYRYWFARHLNGSTNYVGPMNAYNFFCKDGICVRHQVAKYNHPFDGKFAHSRDQMRAGVVCLQAFGLTNQLETIKRRMIERGWRYQNGEIAWPDHRAEFDPANRGWLADLSIVIATTFLLVHSFWDHKMCGVDANHINSLIQFKLAKNTWMVRLACKLYTFRRHGPIWALRTFYKVDNPEIATLMEGPVRVIIMGET